METRHITEEKDHTLQSGFDKDWLTLELNEEDCKTIKEGKPASFVYQGQNFLILKVN